MFDDVMDEIDEHVIACPKCKKHYRFETTIIHGFGGGTVSVICVRCNEELATVREDMEGVIELGKREEISAAEFKAWHAERQALLEKANAAADRSRLQATAATKAAPAKKKGRAKR